MKKMYLFFALFLVCINTVSAQLVVADKTAWSVLSYSNQYDNSSNAAANVIDGNYSTIWHTSWDAGAPGYPHEIVVDMGKIYSSIPAFLYLPRQDESGNGAIKGYSIYFKQNAADAWGSPISGEFQNSKNLQAVDLSNLSISARYFKFEATSPITSGQSFASAAELGIATTIDITKKYNLKLSTDNSYLQQKQVIGSEDNGDFSLQTLSNSNATFEYTFIPIVGKTCVYNIAVNNSYLKVSGGWKCVLENIDTQTPTNNQFVLEEKNGAYLFRPLGRANLAENKCIGLDNSTVGNRIYGDKDKIQWAYWELANGVAIPPVLISKYPAENATDVYYRNTAIEVEFNRVVTLASANGLTLKNALNQDVEILSSSIIGNKLVLTTNPLALNTVYTVTIPSGTIEDFSDNITWSFTTANLTLPSEGVYQIINTNANYYLTYPLVAPKDDSPLSVSSIQLTGNDVKRQEFQLTIPDANYPDIYNIKENLTESYLYLSLGNWRIGLITSNPGNSAKFVLIPDGNNFKVKALSNYSNNDFFAPDNNTDGVGCYLNKQSRNTWQLIRKSDITTSNTTLSETNTAVYPSLCKGLFTVNTTSKAQIKVVDISGKEHGVYTSDGKIDIFLNAPDGIYFILINTVEGNSVHKVLLKK